MGLGGKQNKAQRELPMMEFERDGIAVYQNTSTGWYIQNGEGWMVLRGLLQLRGFSHAASRVNELDSNIGWLLEIKRTKKDHRYNTKACNKAFIATVMLNKQPTPRSPDLQHEVMRGTCGSWSDAVKEVTCFGARGIVDAMRKSGSLFYGDNGERWSAIRPFIVKYPWKDAAEPNFAHSPFMLPRGVSYFDECDGATHYVHGWNDSEARTHAERLKCNAFLKGPDASGTYRVSLQDGYYWKDYPIDIDDWRARLIANAAD
jgi:hypothetical protein